MLNVRPRPLVVNATGAVQKNNTPVDPKPRAHTQNRQPRQSPNALNFPAVELATLKRSLSNAVSHLLFPTSLFLSVLLHVFALSSSLDLNIFLSAFQLLRSPLSFLSPPLSLHSKKPSRSLTLHVCSSSSFFPRCIFNGFLHVFFTLSLGYSSLSPSASSFSLLFLPLFLFRTSLTRSRWLQRFALQPVLPAPWRPTSTRTSTSLRASCQAHSLLAGPRLLPFGGLCQRGVETQAVTPSCPII